MGKVQFGSRMGLIAATVGSAVGLGNVWRFPAEAQAGGGAAFVLIYIACIFLFGIPVMLTEFALGRGTRCNAVDAFPAATPAHRGWRRVGLLGVASAYIILSFYLVVAGWTLSYLWESITGALYAPVPGEAPDLLFAERMADQTQGAVWPVAMTWLILAGNAGVLILGVQKGIERISNLLMPLLVLLLLIFCCVSLSLPGAADGLAFFLKPDFSRITWGTVIDALGQAFFSLSLGMGALITYSSYFPDKTKLPSTAVTVSLLDLMVALLMGLIIFPAVMTFGLTDHGLAGQTLVFVTMPEIFARMGGAQFWSVLFFTLLLVAAFTSTISLGEVAVAWVQERWQLTRRRAVLCTLAPLLPLSAAVSLSLGEWDTTPALGINLFSLFDNLSTNVMLPLGALLTCVYIGWVAPRRFFAAQMSHPALTRVLYPLVRYAAPLLILVIMTAGLLP